MTRLLLAGALAAAAFAPLAPAHAEVLRCDNVPVLVNCFTWRSGTAEHCDVWIKNVAPGCFNVEDLLRG
jgi:hypothetical protein